MSVDASTIGAGGVLMQEDDSDIEHPICYFSKKFSKCQRNSSTIEKEALALVLVVRHFEVYLGGHCSLIKVYTDHNPLAFLSKMSNSNQHVMLWSLVHRGTILTSGRFRQCSGQCVVPSVGC